MTLKDLTISYQNKIKLLEVSRKENALVIAGDYTALIINRVQNQGESSDGSKFKKYSDNPLPLFFFGDGNSKTKADRFKKDVKKKKTEPSYENFRQYLGLPTDKRTLTMTGDMFKSIRPEILEHNDFVTIVEIKARDKFNQDKVNWNSGELGISIISANQVEKQMVENANKKRVETILNQYQ